MDSTSDGCLGLNEAVLHLNLQGALEVELKFFAADSGDEAQPLPDGFVGHSNGDGVCISDDGNIWYTIVTADELTMGVAGAVFVVDLDAEVERVRQQYDVGFGYGTDFLIKFQQHDNSTYPNRRAAMG